MVIVHTIIIGYFISACVSSLLTFFLVKRYYKDKINDLKNTNQEWKKMQLTLDYAKLIIEKENNKM